VVSDAVTVFIGISELLERRLFLEILHAVHNPAVTFGYLRSARTVPAPIDSLLTAIPALPHSVSHALSDADAVINGEYILGYDVVFNAGGIPRIVPRRMQ
jgi:hypothetical protein